MTACVVYLISVCKAKCILLFAAVTPPTSPVPHLTLSTNAATVHKYEAHAAHYHMHILPAFIHHLQSFLHLWGAACCCIIILITVCSSHAGLLGR